MNKLFKRVLRDDIELVLDLSPTELIIKADAGQIEQVLLNIVVNARDATPQGGRITLRTKRVDIAAIEKNVPDSKPGTYAYISISDTGVGIYEEDMNRIFDPFFTTKARNKGTGLGLSMVYNIITQYKGWINVDSKVGVGTTFHLYLPLIAEENEKKTIEILENLPVNPVTILVNEPNEALRQAMIIALQQQGHTVIKAKNGQEAIDLAVSQGNLVDLFITASVFPKMSARELIDRMKVINPDIKILYTYSDYQDFKRQGLKESEVELLEKPFSLKDLSKKIQEMFQQA